MTEENNYERDSPSLEIKNKLKKVKHLTVNNVPIHESNTNHTHTHTHTHTRTRAIQVNNRKLASVFISVEFNNELHYPSGSFDYPKITVKLLYSTIPWTQMFKSGEI